MCVLAEQLTGGALIGSKRNLLHYMRPGQFLHNLDPSLPSLHCLSLPWLATGRCYVTVHNKTAALSHSLTSSTYSSKKQKKQTLEHFYPQSHSKSREYTSKSHINKNNINKSDSTEIPWRVILFFLGLVLVLDALGINVWDETY